MTPLPPAGDSNAETIGPTRAGTSSPVGGPALLGPLRPGAPFGTRYRILRELGAGGMGVVYQAWDDELGVAVALKVIRPEVVADPDAARDIERRFKRELLLARQVTHKHVVRIHDLGEVEGIKYLTMPFIDGRDLASVLRETGTLPVPRALRIARQVATGLLAAHEAGVVHRDLKPENIMLDADDQALIMDFGISRSVGAGGTMTAHGAIVGTLEYMAPEQGRGAQVDHRADIYAFGLMLRDMLVGRGRLTSSDSAIAEMMARMQQPLPPMRLQQPAIPEALDRIVARCSDPDPEQRYATTGELVAALDALDAEGRALVQPAPVVAANRWLPAVAGVLLLAIGAAGAALWWKTRGPSAPAAAPEPVSVLIADFDNQAGDPVFDGALEQALAIALEGSPMIAVYPQRSARRLAAQLAPTSNGRLTTEVGQLIARREDVRVLLAGRIGRQNDRYRLSIQATDAASGREIVTAGRDVQSKADVLQAVAAVAEQLRSGLGESSSDMARLAAAETITAGSLEAMRAYARGQELLNAGNYAQALEAFQEATVKDPEMGRAYSAVGAIYVNLKQLERAEGAFQQAMKHTDRMNEREKYRTQATYFIGVAGNYEKAIENYEALIQRFPADNAAYGNLALAYLKTANVKRAREVARKGLEIYPRNLLQRTNLAAYTVYAADFDAATAEAEAVLKENAAYEFAYLPLALSYAGRGQIDAARAVYARLAEVSETGRSLAAAGYADVELHRGVPDAAISTLQGGVALDEKLESVGELAIKHVMMAEAHLAAGRPTLAIAAARKAASLGRHLGAQVLAARVFIHAGQEDAAREIASDLEKRLQNETAAYARIIRAEIALRRKAFPESIELLKEAGKRHDAWLVHFLLGRVYMEAGPQHATEAKDEFELCYQRRGEAMDLFFTDSPTVRYLPPLYYWLGRAREAAGARESAKEAYEQYVKARAGAASDPFLADARRRAGS